ncbi:MAG: MgtC/SapB family protein [Bacteroidia bacterium]|nr:MgtC/SapB family protein [Bacteroidia bacterium]
MPGLSRINSSPLEETFIIQTDTFQLTQWEFFVRMLVACGIGFVIGLEREHSYIRSKEEIFAGVRTFVFVVLLGFLSTLLSFIFNDWVLIAGFLGVIAMVGISYWISGHKGQIGGTTEFAILLSFLLGATTLLGHLEASLALTVIMVVLLSVKVTLRSIIDRITQDEMYAFIQFVVLALLLFPFLPNRTIDPWEIFNPREVGWVIVLTSGLGFVGYMLMKFLGSDKGILLTGIVGGLVSSTVVTWVFSKKSKEVPELSLNSAVAILAASTIMIVRVMVWITIFKPPLLGDLFLPLLIMLLAGLGTAIYFHYKHEKIDHDDEDIPLGEPLNLREAIFFGVMYTAILFIVSYANEQFGSKGIYISSAIASLTDIDAISISVSKLAGDTIDFLTAQNAILLATLCNTIIKIGIAVWAGSKSLRRYILIGYGIIFIAGIIGFFIINS